MNALDLLYIPLAAVTAPAWAWKKRAGWGERFGKIAPLPQVGEGLSNVNGTVGSASDAASRGAASAHPRRRRILLHAVSVGEVSALRELVPRLTPEADVVVSATTDTGLARAKDLYSATCHVVRYPLDFSWAVARFLDAVRPDVVGLVELEVWPNFVRACTQRGIPVGVINGRLSPRSFKGYRKIRFGMAPTFRRLVFVAVQDAAYLERFVAMGVPRERCAITGTMKWDSAKIEASVAGAEELARELGIDRTKPLIVAGSTAEDEEALLHAACPPGVQLLCAPRKPEHFDEAAAAMPGCVRMTRVRAGGQGGGGGDRFLLDTIGELRKAYALATVVVMGRSFGGLFGSDPIEPIALGKPTVIGPRVSDFLGSVEAFEAGGGIARATRENLGFVLKSLLEDRGGAEAQSERGLSVIRANQGASVRHAELLLGVNLSEPRSRTVRKELHQSSA